MISIDRMQEMLEDIANEFPEAFYEKLNGGICLLPETRTSAYAKRGDLYTLGEYHRNAMGRYINIYYGSFCRVYGYLDEPALYEQLKKTLAHEFTHHMEDLAGERGLEIKDRENLDKYLYGYEDDD